MGELDEVLAVTWDGGAPSGPSEAGAVGVARGHLGEGWLIGHAINGGVLMALGASAAASGLAARGAPRPAHLGSALPVRGTRRAGRGAGRGAAGGAHRVDGRDPRRAAGRRRAAARAGADDGHVRHARPRRARAPRPGRRRRCPARTSACPPRRDSSPLAAVIAVLDRLDARIDPSTAGFAVGRPSGRGVIRAWLRLRDGREPDAAMLPYAVDALMPVSFDLGAPGWAPTMELTGQTAGPARPGLAAARDDHRHRGGRPARSRTSACGTPPAGSSPGRGSSPGCGCPATSLLGCPHESPAVDAVAAPGRAARHPGAGRGGARGVHPAALAPGAAAPHPGGRGRVAGAGGRRQRRARGGVGAGRRRARHRAGASTWSPSPDPVEVTDAGGAGGDRRDRARARGGAHRPAAGAGAAAHGGGDRAGAGRRARPAAARGGGRAGSSPTSGRRRMPRR